MARMQLPLPQELKADIERFDAGQGISANEAIRLLCRRGLAACGQAPPVSVVVVAVGHRVRELERRLAECRSAGQTRAAVDDALSGTPTSGQAERVVPGSAPATRLARHDGER